MCDFITVAFPKHLGELFKNHMPQSLTITEKFSNPTLASHIPTEYVQALITDGSCSCGLFFSQEDVDDAKADFAVKDMEKIRKKYQKMNWSNAKIERVLTEIIMKESKRVFSHPELDVGFRKDIRDAISKFVETNSSIYIIVHEYCGQIAEERFRLQGRKNIVASRLRSNEYILVRDILYTVIR